jgi:hypothetical protein
VDQSFNGVTAAFSGMADYPVAADGGNGTGTGTGTGTHTGTGGTCYDANVVGGPSSGLRFDTITATTTTTAADDDDDDDHGFAVTSGVVTNFPQSVVTVREIGLCYTCWWYSLCNFQYRQHYENTCSYNFDC